MFGEFDSYDCDLQKAKTFGEGRRYGNERRVDADWRYAVMCHLMRLHAV
jgi:hypothetical protein